MILVTGAGGKTGRAVVQALAQRGASVRAFVFRRDYEPALKKLGANEVDVGDILDPIALVKATRDAQAIYHIAPNVTPNEVEMGRAVVAAARAGNVRRLVFHSVLHPQTETMPHHWHKLRVEELLFASGLDVTILQPAPYMQNVLAALDTAAGQAIYRVPYPVETRLSMVDLRDVAEAAARVLTEAGHAGATYELAGPEALAQTQVADALGDRLGRSVKAEQLPITTWAVTAREAGLGDYQIATLMKMFHYYEQFGLRGNPRVLGWLLDRQPNNFRHFVLDEVKPA